MVKLPSLFSKDRKKRRKPLSAAEETELLCTRIGVALFACQLVERTLHHVMTRMPIGNAHQRRNKRPTLNAMIREIERQGVKEFASVLDEFRHKRNAFVHGLLDADGVDPHTSEGRMTAYMMSAEVHSMASALMKAFRKIEFDE
jgi:hypothetical protein